MKKVLNGMVLSTLLMASSGFADTVDNCIHFPTYRMMCIGKSGEVGASTDGGFGTYYRFDETINADGSSLITAYYHPEMSYWGKFSMSDQGVEFANDTAGAKCEKIDDKKQVTVTLPYETGVEQMLITEETYLVDSAEKKKFLFRWVKPPETTASAHLVCYEK